jgi:hypothetical protein
MYGGQGRNRTADASLFRAALYQLSYLATEKGSLGNGCCGRTNYNNGAINALPAAGRILASGSTASLPPNNRATMASECHLVWLAHEHLAANNHENLPRTKQMPT